MKWENEYFGILVLAIGALLAFLKRKRRFDRTNQFGLEQFPSYSAKLGARMKDGLLTLASLVLLSAGVLILAFHFEDSWGWAVVLPVYLFCLFLVIGS